MDVKNLAILFSATRKSLGITQAEIANQIEVDRSSIAQFERGHAALSTETILRIAPLLSINPDFVTGKTSNPFLSDEIIKMFLPEKMDMTWPDFSMIYLLLDSNKRIDFFYLLMPPVFGTKLARLGYGEGYVYAVAVRDGDGNYFLFRTRPRPAIRRPGHIAGTQELQTEIKAKALQAGKRVSFSVHNLDEALFERIRDWTVERSDIEPLFSVAVESHIELTADEAKLILTIRDRHIDAAELFNMFDLTKKVSDQAASRETRPPRAAIDKDKRKTH
ncbi:MAG: helix-turn-helix domain-containing protein [Dissulfurispiraceae bacterium]